MACSNEFEAEITGPAPSFGPARAVMTAIADSGGVARRVSRIVGNRGLIPRAVRCEAIGGQPPKRSGGGQLVVEATEDGQHPTSVAKGQFEAATGVDQARGHIHQLLPQASG